MCSPDPKSDVHREERQPASRDKEVDMGLDMELEWSWMPARMIVDAGEIFLEACQQGRRNSVNKPSTYIY